ncbi:hypothetical protein P9443_19085 [Peribacillus frigoritolerans]|uniref:hypothetical protein n=1 Tax=Peribacillus frigoritolerans TaxID=450367 RepID=UPI002E1F86E2|nr:hypothetical protein [Peribacillus frigoritolerans]
MNEKLAKEKLKIHFMYIVIILVLSNVMIGAFLLFGKNNALAHLSSAGTLLSIVLAIVAILITLWDIAGQKNSIYEIKDQIEKIKKVSDDIVNTSETIKNNAEASDDILNSLKDFEAKSGTNFDRLYGQIDQVIEKVEQSNGVNGDDNEKQNLIKQLNQMKNDLDISLAHSNKKLEYHFEKNKIRNRAFFHYLLTTYNHKKVDKDEFLNIFKEYINNNGRIGEVDAKVVFRDFLEQNTEKFA